MLFDTFFIRIVKFLWQISAVRHPPFFPAPGLHTYLQPTFLALGCRTPVITIIYSSAWGGGGEEKRRDAQTQKKEEGGSLLLFFFPPLLYNILSFLFSF